MNQNQKKHCDECKNKITNIEIDDICSPNKMLFKSKCCNTHQIINTLVI